MDWRQLFHGYVRTPQLWRGSLNGIPQLELPEIKQPPYSNTVPNSLRLGHIAEHFALEYWSHIPELEVACHNVQIEGESQTLGEIDAILHLNEQWTHVEMAYKFYLFDPTHGNTDLEHWIGPNRKDTLTAKLERLLDHQLPLIETREAKSQLKAYVPGNTPITSSVWIKAQLFVPFEKKVAVAPLNQSCVRGFYLHTSELHVFTEHSFFLPSKIEWLLEPNVHVAWQSLEQISVQIQPLLDRQFSPLLWMKAPNGSLEKIFVVWWSNSQ